MSLEEQLQSVVSQSLFLLPNLATDHYTSPGRLLAVFFRRSPRDLSPKSLELRCLCPMDEAAPACSAARETELSIERQLFVQQSIRCPTSQDCDFDSGRHQSFNSDSR